MQFIKVVTIIACSCIALQCKAQQSVDSLALIYNPYHTAMGILYKSKRTLPQDVAAYTYEWQRLNAQLKQVSDSVGMVNQGRAATYFELQRLVDLIVFNTMQDSLIPRINRLNQYTASHQDDIIENQAQFNKVAECLMGISSDTLFNEVPIAAFNAGFTLALYKQLNTQDWDNENRKTYFSSFASQYAKKGNIRMAEKFYRQVDTLWVKEEETHITEKQQFALPDTMQFQNGSLYYTGKSWQNLQKGKIILYPQHQDLYELVYLISTLRAFDNAYRVLYDVVLLYDSTTVSTEYLSTIKQNLAFDDYYLTPIAQGTAASMEPLPVAILLNAANQVVYKTQQLNALFKKLNEPIETQKDQEKIIYDADLARQKEALKNKALQMADSTHYKVTHSNITFTLKGLWEIGLSTQLSPVPYSEADMIPDTTKPYLARFQVKHPQYVSYQLLVFVNGKRQEITITSGNLYKKTEKFFDRKNRKFHQALETIDQSLYQQANYAYLLKNYPFKNTPFTTHIKKQETAAIQKEKKAIASLKSAEKILQRYAEAKRKQVRQMM